MALRIREPLPQHLTSDLAQENNLVQTLVASHAIGAMAFGAFAVGAVAIGALAIGKLVIERARIRRLEIDELVVRRLRVSEELDIPLNAHPLE